MKGLRQFQEISSSNAFSRVCFSVLCVSVVKKISLELFLPSRLPLCLEHDATGCAAVRRLARPPSHEDHNHLDHLRPASGVGDLSPAQLFRAACGGQTLCGTCETERRG